MSRKDRLFDKISMGLELSSEALPGQPLVEIVGQRRVLVEHHFGICLYTCEEIRIRVSYGLLGVCGSGLKIACMTRERIVIVGQISGITLLGRR